MNNTVLSKTIFIKYYMETHTAMYSNVHDTDQYHTGAHV